MTISEVIKQLHCDQGIADKGKPWIESLPETQSDPLAQAKQVIEAVTEVGNVMKQLHSVGCVFTGFDPGMLVKAKTGVHIRNIHQLISRNTQFPLPLHESPHYATPEVTAESDKDIGPPTDVFHLGTLFYYLASRKFPGGTTRSGLRAAQYQLPRFRIYNPAFPLGFEAVQEKATQISPRRRYSEIDIFLDALNEALQDAILRRKGSQEFTFEIGAKTELGTVKGKICPKNQDSVFPDPERGEAFSLPEKKCDVLAIADGVTNCKYGSGSDASKIVIEVIKEAAASLLEKNPFDPGTWTLNSVFKLLEEAVHEATSKISKSVPSGDDVKPEMVMSSTLIAAMFKFHEVIIGNTGNSKAFLVTPNYIEQINLDDDVLHARFRSGMSPEEVHPLRGNRSLRRVVGACKIIDGQIVPDTARVRFSGTRLYLGPGDMLLMCSDGLVDPGVFLNQEEVHEMIQANTELTSQELCELLIEEADSRQKTPSTGDNISCIIVKALPA